MNRHILAACLIFGCMTVISSAACAQESHPADSLYNRGVQAYFRGSSAEADSSLSRLKQVDPTDPRAYYFRALSLMQQGREGEARAEMELGAHMEAQYPFRFD